MQSEKMITDFVGTGGKAHACGTCLKLRSKSGTVLRPLANRKILLGIIEESDTVLTF